MQDFNFVPSSKMNGSIFVCYLMAVCLIRFSICFLRWFKLMPDASVEQCLALVTFLVYLGSSAIASTRTHNRGGKQDNGWASYFSTHIERKYHPISCTAQYLVRFYAATILFSFSKDQRIKYEEATSPWEIVLEILWRGSDAE